MPPRSSGGTTARTASPVSGGWPGGIDATQSAKTRLGSPAALAGGVGTGDPRTVEVPSPVWTTNCCPPTCSGLLTTRLAWRACESNCIAWAMCELPRD
jgi:hypothetical protein